MNRTWIAALFAAALAPLAGNAFAAPPVISKDIFGTAHTLDCVLDGHYSTNGKIYVTNTTKYVIPKGAVIELRMMGSAGQLIYPTRTGVADKNIKLNGRMGFIVQPAYATRYSACRAKVTLGMKDYRR
jgi:hypothetical protein